LLTKSIPSRTYLFHIFSLTKTNHGSKILLNKTIVSHVASPTLRKEHANLQQFQIRWAANLLVNHEVSTE